jgi:hyaluronate lyase
VDNADGPAWVTTNGGPWIVSGGAAFPNYYGADFLYCPEGASGSAIFRPRLPEAGTYSVYLWHPAGPAWYLFADNAPLDIITGGTTNTVYLDEQTNYGLWDLLGTFAFSAGTNGFVQVRPAPGASVTPADAVRFIK